MDPSLKHVVFCSPTQAPPVQLLTLFSLSMAGVAIDWILAHSVQHRDKERAWQANRYRHRMHSTPIAQDAAQKKVSEDHSYWADDLDMVNEHSPYTGLSLKFNHTIVSKVKSLQLTVHDAFL